MRKPIIAAINGHAVGIGLTLAMQCDIRLVAAEAKLAFAHVRRGVLPDAHSHWTVPRTIGFARTAELFLSLDGSHSLVIVEHDMKFIHALTVGNPAKKVRVLSAEQIEQLHYSADHYVRMKDDYLAAQ